MDTARDSGLVLSEARYPGSAPIDAYGNGGFRFADMSHRGSILLLPSGIQAWSVTGDRRCISGPDCAYIAGEGPDRDPACWDRRSIPDSSASHGAGARGGGPASGHDEHGSRGSDIQCAPVGKQGGGGCPNRGRCAEVNVERTAASSDADYILKLVRDRDRSRYVADLFLSPEHRTHILALHALNAEICSIPASVGEAELGEIRLQWWYDAVSAVTDPENEAETPVMRAVASAIRNGGLPTAAILHLIDAHRRDLYGDPPAILRDLEGYFGETDSALFQMASLVLGSGGTETADASGHAGIAFGLTRQLAELPSLRRQGRQVASADLLEIYDLDAESFLSEKPPPGAQELIIHLANLASEHLSAAKREIRELSDEFQTAFLPIAILSTMIRRIRKNPTRLLERSVSLSPLSIVTRITGAALTGI